MLSDAVALGLPVACHAALSRKTRVETSSTAKGHNRRTGLPDIGGTAKPPNAVDEATTSGSTPGRLTRTA